MMMTAKHPQKDFGSKTDRFGGGDEAISPSVVLLVKVHNRVGALCGGVWWCVVVVWCGLVVCGSVWWWCGVVWWCVACGVIVVVPLWRWWAWNENQ